MIPVDVGLGEPPPKLGSRATAEWLADGHLHRTRRLTDDRDAITNGPRDDRPSAFEISRVDALRAGADACMKAFEEALAVNPGPSHLVNYLFTVGVPGFEPGTS